MKQVIVTEQQLELLIEGLQKLKATGSKKVSGKVLKEERKEIPEKLEWQPPSNQVVKKNGEVLQVEGGYIPGRYALADKLVADLILARKK